VLLPWGTRRSITRPSRSNERNRLATSTRKFVAALRAHGSGVTGVSGMSRVIVGNVPSTGGVSGMARSVERLIGTLMLYSGVSGVIGGGRNANGSTHGSTRTGASHGVHVGAWSGIDNSEARGLAGTDVTGVNVSIGRSNRTGSAGVANGRNGGSLGRGVGHRHSRANRTARTGGMLELLERGVGAMGAMGAMSLAVVTVGVDTGIELVGDLRVVRPVVRSGMRRTDGSYTNGMVSAMATVTVGVNTRIELVRDVRVVRTIVGGSGNTSVSVVV